MYRSSFWQFSKRAHTKRENRTFFNPIFDLTASECDSLPYSIVNSADASLLGEASTMDLEITYQTCFICSNVL